MPATLEIGSDEQFAAVREFLKASGFTLETVVTRLHEKLPYDFTQFRPGPGDTDPQDALELLIRVFVLGEGMASRLLPPLVPMDVCDALVALRLLEPLPGAPDHVYCPVALCPVEDIFVASDRWSTPDQQPFSLKADAVYPALTLNTQRFLGGIFRTPCQDVLDLCSGTGVAAFLAAARFAERAVSTDVAERCLAFAEFNRRLNALDNVIVTASDVYDGVEGQTFDRILAHPPYVPVLRPKWVYHDGGADGEQITRRIIEGLPRFLRPGGSFHCHTMATDRDQPLQERIRGWLGEAQAEFDLALVIWNRLDPARWATASALRDRSVDDLDQWKKLFEEWRVDRLLDVSITVVRHAEACAPLDVRRLGDERSGPAEVDWLLRWQRVASLPQVHNALLRASPRAAEGMRFTVSHVIEDGELRAADCRAAVSYPFQVDIGVDRWMPLLLTACDGRRTGAELYDLMRRQGHIPAETPPEKFAGLLAEMVSQGFVVVNQFAPPEVLKAAAAGQ
jgi:SAM-dependent methyltransferase